IHSFEEAWKLQAVRKQGHKIPKTTREDPDRLQYGSYCKLGEQLQRVYKQVPRSHVLVIVLDDLRDNPRQEYLKILRLLNIDDDGRNEFQAENSRKTTKSPHLNILLRRAAELKKRLGIQYSLGFLKFVRAKTSGKGKKEISEQLTNELKQYFKEDVALLSELIGRNLRE